MDSHILIPKGVFKHFVNDKLYFYKYDFSNKEKGITKGYPKSTYTEKDYYSKSMERFLNQNIETRLSDLISFVDLLAESPNKIKIDNKIIDIATIYLYSLIARNPQMCKFISKGSKTFQFLPKQNQHDLMVELTLNNIQKCKTFDKFDISFIRNETEIPFVLPTRGIYEFNANGIICANVPISSFSSILLKEKGKTFHEINSNQKELIFIKPENKDMILKLNTYAFEKQYKENEGFVICRDKEQIEYLILNKI